jgi:hypothetical protein
MILQQRTNKSQELIEPDRLKQRFATGIIIAQQVRTTNYSTNSPMIV